MNISLRRLLYAMISCAVLASIAVLVIAVLLDRNALQRRVTHERDRVQHAAVTVATRPTLPGRPRRAMLRALRGESMIFVGILTPDGESLQGDPVPMEMTSTVLQAVQMVKSESDNVFVAENRGEDPPVVAAVVVAPDGRLAWAGTRVDRVTMSPWLIAVALLVTLGVVGLVYAGVRAVVSVRRDATALRDGLHRLEADLNARVETPSVLELVPVRKGIEELAGSLREARVRETELRKHLAEKERLASMGRVVAGVAHEVRNPLASIKLKADLAARMPGTSTLVVEDLRDISNEVARLDRLVADLLVVARRRTGNRARTDLLRVVEDRLKSMLPWTDAEGICVELEGDRVELTIDAEGIGRVIDNLVRNAVQFSPRGGTVTVRRENARVSGQVRLVVSDRGPGIPPERAGELFEPFFTTRGEGTGLGLALSRSIVESHGGTLTYERHDDETMFVVELPIEPMISPTANTATREEG